MANKFTRFLGGVAQGLLNPKGNLGDFQHASRLYLNNAYALAPRTKFLYHVYFDINPEAITAPQWAEKHQQEAGLLVKTADLPKFQFETVTKNQYNRKKIAYKMINYEAINIVMHDDNVGVINSLWALYYGYYIRDRHLKPDEAYSKDPYSSADVFKRHRYGLDNGQFSDFFRSITIYTMSRRRFNSYTLINPKITAWNSSNVDQSDGRGIMDATMTIEYEAVQYGTGTVVKGKEPKGFADLYYDLTPSSLSVAGGGGSLFGIGDTGFVTNATDIFGEVFGGDAFSSPQSFINTAIKAINTYEGIKNITKEGLRAEALNIILTPGALTGVAGSLGAAFPSRTPSESQTNTEPKGF